MTEYHLEPNARPGDIVGFAGTDFRSRWIAYGTLCWPGSGLVHVGMCVRSPIDNDNGLALWEATTCCTRPCMYEGQIVHGAQFQPLGERVYEAKCKVWLYRLRRPLTDEESRELTALCIADAGKRYDMPGALRSRSLLCGWLFRRVKPHRQDLDQLFCSETVANRLDDLGRWDPGNASEWNPHALGQAIVKDGVTEKRVRLSATLIQGV